MKLSKRTNTIILWTISVALLLGMIVSFTPTIGGLFGSTGANLNSGPAALLVNDQEISEIELARALQNTGHTSFDGEVAEDLRLIAFDNLIQTTVLEQAASGIRVSDNELRDAVNEWRVQNNVAGRANDQRYLSAIGQAGFDDQSFRAAFREQLKLEKYREQVTEGVSVSDEEVRLYYDLNEQAYQSEERIVARQIVVDDEALANQLLEQAQDGADFQALATENSVERAEQGGALGSASDSTEPQAVGRAALPTPVAVAAFGLQAAGLTDVINFNNRYHLINIEEFIAAGTKPFEEVEEEVREDALAVKQTAVLEELFTSLREDANITSVEGATYSFNDEVLARVGDEEIMRSSLARVVYNDPQISQSLRPDTAQLITGLFKPSYLERLIDNELAFQGASDLDTEFFGPKNQIASSALTYVAKDATATEEEYQEYYDANLARFTVPARAIVSRVNFDTEEAATSFREAMLEGGDVTELAEAASAELVDLGTVNPGSLAVELDRVLFETEAFAALPESENEISDVLVLTETIETPFATTPEVTDDATDETADATDTDVVGDGDGENLVVEEVIDTYVVLVADRTPETVRPFDEVSAQVESSVLATKRSELQTTWLDGLRESISVENILADQAAAAAAEAEAAAEAAAIEAAAAQGEEEATEEGTTEEISDGEEAPDSEEAPADDSGEEGDGN